jgi:hypothetical protein
MWSIIRNLETSRGPALVTLSVCILALAFATASQAQCTKDTDCKGERVCEDGQCVGSVASDRGSYDTPQTSRSPSRGLPAYCCTQSLGRSGPFPNFTVPEGGSCWVGTPMGPVFGAACDKRLGNKWVSEMSKSEALEHEGSSGAWISSGLDIALVLIGVFLVGVFFYAVLRPTKLSTTQRFEGYGVKAEVSLQLVVLLVGVSLAASGLIVRLSDRHEEFAELQGKLDETERSIGELRAQLTVARAPKTIDLSINASLAGVDERKLPKVEDMECHYVLAGENRIRTAHVDYALGPLLYTVAIPLLRVDSVISNMTIVDKATHVQWRATNIGPTSPLVTFRRD